MAITILVVIKLLYFALPMYIANMSPVLGKNVLRWLARPVDFNKEFMGKPILGSHKTWRGVILAVLVGVLIAGIQFALYPYLDVISLIDYQNINWVGLGALMGFGAILGDMVKSFFKRRVSVKPGKPWIPFDQIDFTIGGIAFASFLYFPGWIESIIIITVSLFLHIAVNHIGYYIGVRDVKW